jgi:DNA-binding GntR family transcriptional regulator
MRLLSESVEILWAVLDHTADGARAEVDHRAIVSALRRGDVAASQNAVREHITRNMYRIVEHRLNAMYPTGGAE